MRPSAKTIVALLLSQFFVWIDSDPRALNGAWDEYLADSASIFALTWFNLRWLERMTGWLDAHLPWSQARKRRVCIQTALGVALPALFTVLWVGARQRFVPGLGARLGGEK